VCAIRVRKLEDGTLGIPQGKLPRQARP
jgi:hypothetical protein